MKLNVDSFCGLATTKAWQDWLATTAPVLHARLLTHLRAGRGCASNRDQMLGIVDALRDVGLGEATAEFLRTKFPFVIRVEPEIPFPNWVPGVYTRPRREVHVTGDFLAIVAGLRRRALNVDSVVHDGRLYVEYILPGDSDGERWLQRWRERRR